MIHTGWAAVSVAMSYKPAPRALGALILPFFLAAACAGEADPFSDVELDGPGGKTDGAANVAVGACDQTATIRAGGDYGYGVVWFKGEAGRTVSFQSKRGEVVPTALFAPNGFGYDLRGYDLSCGDEPCLETRLEVDGYHAWVLLPTAEVEVEASTVCGAPCGATMQVQPLQSPVAAAPFDLMIQVQDACAPLGEQLEGADHTLVVGDLDVTSWVAEAQHGPNAFRHEAGYGIIIRGVELQAGEATLSASVSLANGQKATYTSSIDVAKDERPLRAEYFFSAPDASGRPLPPNSEPGSTVRVLVSGLDGKEPARSAAARLILGENVVQAETWIDAELSEFVGNGSVVVAFQVPDIAPGHRYAVIEVEGRNTAMHAFEIADAARRKERAYVNKLAMESVSESPGTFGNAFLLIGPHAPLVPGTVINDGLDGEAVRTLSSETWLRWVIEPAGATEQPVGVWMLINAETGETEVIQRKGWPKVVPPAGAAAVVDLGQMDTRIDMMFYQGVGPIPPGFVPGTTGWQPEPVYDPNYVPEIPEIEPEPEPDTPQPPVIGNPSTGTGTPFFRPKNGGCETVYKIGVVVQMDDQGASRVLSTGKVRTRDIFDEKAKRMVQVLRGAGFQQVFHIKPPQLRGRRVDGLHVASLATYNNLFRWIAQNPPHEQKCTELFVTPIAHGIRRIAGKSKKRVGPAARTFVKTSEYGWLKFAERNAVKIGAPTLSLDYLSSLSLIVNMYEALGKKFAGKITFVTNACHAGAAETSVTKWQKAHKTFPLRWLGTSKSNELTRLALPKVKDQGDGRLRLDLFFIEALATCFEKVELSKRWDCVKDLVNRKAKKLVESGQHPVSGPAY